MPAREPGGSAAASLSHNGIALPGGCAGAGASVRMKLSAAGASPRRRTSLEMNMLRRSPRCVGSLLAAAAAFAGAQGALAPAALAQGAAPTISEELAAPAEVIARAQSLVEAGKLVHAYEALSGLLASAGVDLTDDERSRALALSSSINRRIRALDSYEVSLQKADFALSTDDLRAAEHHANAVANSGTASVEQAERAAEILRAAETRRAQLTPVMRARLADAERAMDGGRYAEAKRALEAVARSGVDLNEGEQEMLLAAQEQIVAMERSRGERFDASIAAAGVMQPGVVTRDEQDDAIEEDAWQPLDLSQEAQPGVQPAPAAQPEPQGQELVQVARQLEAMSTMAEADQAYEASRWAEAWTKYQRAVTEFGDLLTEEQLGRARARADEAQIRMGRSQPDLIRQTIDERQLAAAQRRAEFTNRMEQARAALASGDTLAARDHVAAAQATLATARQQQLFSESEYAEMASALSALRGEINLVDEQIRLREQVEQEEASKRAAIEAALTRERERAQKISEAIDRVRALQMEMNYRDALEVVENQILFLDPINPAGLLLRDMLRDNIVYQQHNEFMVERNFGITFQQGQNSEAMIPPRTIVAYPADWPALSARRAGVESTNESAADRQVLSTLENTSMPVDFRDNTLRQALTFFGQFTGVDMDVNWDSLAEIGIDPETTVTLSLTRSNARTVLDRVLEKVSLDPITQADWAVLDGMLQIASEEDIRKHTVLETYDIRDLVFEVPNYDEAPEIDLQSVLQSSQGGGGQSPFQQNQQQDIDRLPLEERIDQIKEIIFRNVDEESWPEGGGTTGAMYDLNGLLLVRNTPKNHREIRSLLSKLREAKAMQINVETRFLLVAQDFFEQVGFDLDVYWNADNNQVRAARATDPTILPSDFFDFGGPGLNRSVEGAPNADGDTITQGVVNPDPWSPIGTGQNSLGLASSLMPGEGIAATILGEAPALGIAGQFLDDIQVDFLVKATQADRRSVQLTAPRLTFTNGQTSNIYVVTQQSFVSDLQPVVSDSAVGFDPELEVVSEGVVMLVEGQVTADRRYVLLNVDTAVSQIEGFAQQAVSAIAGGQLVTSSDTQSFIQLPTVTVTRVQTTVTVPDQGTVLLGGQRLVNETEVETGVPVLSKIPIINRFFSNRIQAREEQTLLILIKPTILIQSEQEEESFPGLGQTLGGLGG